MKVYQVGSMTFTLKYHFEDYFKNNLENYLVKNVNPKYHIEVEIVDEIIRPKGEVTPNSRPKEIVLEDKRHVFAETLEGVRFLITHDHHFQNILLQLNKNIIKSLPRMEYVYLGVIFLDLAIHEGYLPLHGTALIVKEKLIIISAPSGTGKSTIRKHLQMVDNNLLVVNDDKPILSFKDSKIEVLGSPFSGEYAVNQNIKYPLSAIVFLQQGQNNETFEISKTDKVIKIIENIYKPKYEKDWQQVLKQIDILIDKVLIFGFKAVNNVSAATNLIEYLEVLKEPK